MRSVAEREIGQHVAELTVKRVRVVEEVVRVIIDGPQPRARQVNQVDYDSGEESFAFTINFNGERACEDNIVAVMINGTATRVLVDCGAQSIVLGER